MSLFKKLQNVTSEEDVKTIYIDALKLKGVQKNLIDIQTKQVWFEAKHKPTNIYSMFTQLLYYVCHAQKKGDEIPPLLCVIDTEKAALMSTESIFPIFKDKKIKWGKSASQVSPELIASVSPYITDHFVVYYIEHDEVAFLKATNDSIKHGKIIRTNITPDNLKVVFDRWVELIGRELPPSKIKPSDFALLFYADIMHDGNEAVIGDDLQASLIHKNGKPAFILYNQILELASVKGYQEFWNIYHRPPLQEHRSYLLERRDSLIPLDERQFKGAFYTPLKAVEKAYELLNETLGKNWQKNYIVWDMCCGVGNLESKHSNHRNIFMSTLDQDDLNVISTSNSFGAATRFQYDYLNDDIQEDGSIDYSITKKMPEELQILIKNLKNKTPGEKKILVLINPPYAEATDSLGQSKEGVARTKMARYAMKSYGKASNELFTQFLARIQQELPTATVAVFSTLKYVIAPTLIEFREKWTAQYLNGFGMHSKAFDGLNGNFPIAFLIWKLIDSKDSYEFPKKIIVSAYDRNMDSIGEKVFVSSTNQKLLTDWVNRPKSNSETVIPLKNAIAPATSTKDLRGTRWSDNAVAYLNCAGNDLQQSSKLTMLLSSGFGTARGFFVNKSNLNKAAVIFTVRRLVKPTWLNDRDQFLQPNCAISKEFENDCLIWMIFSGSNLTAGTAKDALSWNNQKWQLINHFIPFTEQDVGAKSKFTSNFLSDYIKKLKFSPEAEKVLAEGKKIWISFFKANIGWKVREKYLLDNHVDAGWYQIRNALKESDKNVDFSDFEIAYAELSEKLLPQVFEYGFLQE